MHLSTVFRPLLAASAVFVGALALPAAEPKSESGWVDLFNGKNLDGWVRRSGKADFKVENGEIVGRTVAGEQNSFLCTTKNYADFVLELDFKVHPKLNSGVQIRSHAYDKETTATINGKPRKFPADRVHGYQVEIDPSERAYTGGIYDEARRGKFLADLKDNEAGRKAFKQNEWNHFKIECKGDSMKVWLNGVQTADLKDSMTPSGLIGLQVHQSKSAETLDVHFKNIRLKELK
jgi:hypothetical protein